MLAGQSLGMGDPRMAGAWLHSTPEPLPLTHPSEPYLADQRLGMDDPRMAGAWLHPNLNP